MRVGLNQGWLGFVFVGLVAVNICVLLFITFGLRSPEPIVFHTHIAKPTIAFVTYELYPVSKAGGAATVVDGIVLELLEAGHSVVVIADLGVDLLKTWRQSISQRAGYFSNSL
jgi:hypothetical protein